MTRHVVRALGGLHAPGGLHKMKVAFFASLSCCLVGGPQGCLVIALSWSVRIRGGHPGHFCSFDISQIRHPFFADSCILHKTCLYHHQSHTSLRQHPLCHFPVIFFLAFTGFVSSASFSPRPSNTCVYPAQTCYIFASLAGEDTSLTIEPRHLVAK